MCRSSDRKVKSEPGTHALGLAADILLRGEQALENIKSN